MEFSQEISEKIFRRKYMIIGDKTLDDPLKRIDAVITKYYPHLGGKIIEYSNKKWVGCAGGLYRSAMNINNNVSAVNCTTLFSPEDNMESIAEGWYWWAKFASVGQGEGIDLSNLRPRGAVVHNASNTSTGPVSFIKTYHSIMKEIAQRGRRGASLISLNIRHPDIPSFIEAKDKDGDLDTVNISIKITDDFMNAVIRGKKWKFEFTNRYETIYKEVDAKKLFHLIAEHAWKSGDPGLLFWDTSVRYSNSDVFRGYEISNVNACSEQVLDGHNVCLLSSINLARYNEYGFEKYKELISFMIFVLDAFRREEINLKRSPSKIQIQKLVDMPRIGLGITGLADLFIREKIIYGSEESVIFAEKIFKTLVCESYKASYDIAKNYDKKSFPAYDKNKYKKSEFIKYLLGEKIIDEKILDYQAHVTKNTIAPNGTLTEIVESGGSGIEPIFAKYYIRRERATTNEWKDWFIFNHLVRQELVRTGLDVTKENADKLDPNLWVTAYELNNDDKLNLIKVIQKYIDSSISVTYNLKEDSSVEDVKHIFMQSWKNGAKGVTVYRENSRAGVLITDTNYKKFINNDLKRTSNGVIIRPKKVPHDIHEIRYRGEDYLLLVGILENRPYEIFCTKNEKKKEFPMKNKKKGYVEKIKKGRYNLVVENGEKEIYIENISEKFDSLYLTLGRLVSMSLRHYVPLQFIVEQLMKNNNFFAFEKTVARVLKKYIKEGERVQSSQICPQCKGTEFIYNSGCSVCINCGYSACE